MIVSKCVTLTGNTGKELPGKALNLTAWKGDKAVTLQEIENTLAQQIYDVRGMVRAMGVEAEVGHVDTWNAFTNAANDPVILACDFIGLDAYPYWEGGSIEEAYDLFFKAYQATKDHVQSVGSGAWVVSRRVSRSIWILLTEHSGSPKPPGQSLETTSATPFLLSPMPKSSGAPWPASCSTKRMSSGMPTRTTTTLRLLASSTRTATPSTTCTHAKLTSRPGFDNDWR